MHEFDYIDWLRKQTPSAPRVLVGPGDDCAVILSPPSKGGEGGGAPWLVTTDMLLEGSHFVLAEVGAYRIGRKAMAVNLSDIAAMGGTPIAAFVSVGLPRQHDTKAIAEELYRGMREMADQFDVSIGGGDTNSWASGLVVSVTMMGEPGPQGPILRKGAKPGDWLFVTGPLGGSIRGKHLDFTPRIREALQLQQHVHVHAMIDISDGLSADAFHLCEESGCGLTLFADKIPRNDAMTLENVLGDGEDFELAFAVSPSDGERLLQAQPIAGMTLVHVGVFVEEVALFLEEGGVRRRIPPRGFVHVLGE